MVSVLMAGAWVGIPRRRTYQQRSLTRTFFQAPRAAWCALVVLGLIGTASVCLATGVHHTLSSHRCGCCSPNLDTPFAWSGVSRISATTLQPPNHCSSLPSQKRSLAMLKKQLLESQVCTPLRLCLYLLQNEQSNNLIHYSRR